MDQLSPHHVPVYETSERRRRLWQECADRGQPVVAVRDARRGYIVRYDLQHLEGELSDRSLARLRTAARASRAYPTAGDATDANGNPDTAGAERGDRRGVGADPLSAAEGIGGEAGPVSGELHADTEVAARRLASRLSAVVFDRDCWQ